MENGIVLDLKGFWRSRWGRFLFGIHFLFGLALVGYYSDHLGTSNPIFENAAWFFRLVDWPIHLDLRSYLGFLYGSFPLRVSNGLIVFFYSIPWWGYGYFAEVTAPIIRRRLFG